jgi:class 3 adenylate cyclase
VKIIYPIIACAYVAHFYLFDKPMNLQPMAHWQYFRLSMAGVSVATWLFYTSRTFVQARWYKLPAICTGAVICYFQARVLVWYDASVYFYAFGFVIVAAILLRLGIALSVLYAACIIASQWSSFVEAGLDRPLLYSASVISLIFVVLARSSYSAEVKYFRASQENIDNQRQLIELNIEFTDRLRAFLPKEISRRLFGYVEERRMTILQAIEEVLRPKQKQITCLFSDIRGFTKKTKSAASFVDEGVIPNVRKCTQVIEANGGIPRKIGDLIFAYFDHPDFETNVRRCIAAACDLVEENIRFNTENASDIRIDRHVLVASGPSVVGNLGGFDSSIEITALGNPVNLLSRIDEIVKHPRVRERIATTDVVLDESTKVALQALKDAPLPLCPLDLNEIGVRIRDFEDVPSLWLLKASAETKSYLGILEPSVQGGLVEHLHDARRQVQAIRA